MPRFTIHLLALGLAAAVAGACTRAPAELPTADASPRGASSAASSPVASHAAPVESSNERRAVVPPRETLPLLWDDPKDFVRSAPKSPARMAEYVVPRAGADAEDAEVTVMTFGPRQGGTVDDNVKRWMDQFQPALPTPRRMTRDINGMHVTFVEVAGTFAGNMMPNRQNLVAPQSKAGWRLIGAIVESPSGLWFFKMTGPDLTVRGGAREFEDMVRSVRPR
ncbi:MAG TPA: hypothetical protein VGM06_07535 [Polyangiaceae bacterium]